MHASEVTPEVAERANELYWSSDKSVNQIAEELDLSKGALYAALEPEPAGLGCPLCGDEVTYPNRTAKEREQLDCPTCDWDGGPDETVSYTGGAPTSATRGTNAAEDDALSPSDPDDVLGRDTPLDGDLPAPVRPPPFIAPRISTIAGGALLGAAVGLALVMWARRK